MKPNQWTRLFLFPLAFSLSFCLALPVWGEGIAQKNFNKSSFAEKLEKRTVKKENVSLIGRIKAWYRHFINPEIPPDIGIIVNPCGNGQLDEEETCDDANRISGDGCSENCQIECPLTTKALFPHCPPTCGNGILEIGESCDDRNEIESDDCRNDCTIPTCGDGIVDTARGEECDGGYTCTETCHPVPPPPCVCDEKGCKPNPDPTSNPNYSLCADPTTPWTRIIGTPGVADVGRSIAVDSNGTIYTVSMENMNKVFIRQFDTCGNLVWESQLEDALAFGIDHLDIDVCGNSYVIVHSLSDIPSHALVRKYNYRGDLEWSEEWSDIFTLNAIYGSIAVDPQGVYLYVTFSAAETDSGETILPIRKYNAEEGSVLWVGGPETSRYSFHASDIDAEGNLYVTGRPLTESDDPTPGVYEPTKYLTKYDPDGNRIWRSDLPAVTINTPSVAVTPDNATVYVAGLMGPFPLISPTEILKFSLEEEALLATYAVPALASSFDTAGHRAYGIAIGPEGYIYVTGIDFNNPPTDVTDDYLWLLKLDTDFSLLWSRIHTMPDDGPNNALRISSVAVDPSGFIYVIGSISMSESTSFNSLSGEDIFIKKYTPAGESEGWPEGP